MIEKGLKRMPSTFPLATSNTGRISPSRDVLYQQVDGVAVLLHLESERYFSFDAVGTRIWLMITEHSDIAEICERVLETYDIDEITARRDVSQFIDRLRNAGLVVVEP